MRTIVAAAILVPLLVTSAQAAEPEVTKLQQGDLLLGATGFAHRSNLMHGFHAELVGDYLVAPHLSVGGGVNGGFSTFPSYPSGRSVGALARVGFPLALSSWVTAMPYLELDYTATRSDFTATDGTTSTAHDSYQSAVAGLGLIGLVSEHVFIRLDFAMLSVTRLSADDGSATSLGAGLGGNGIALGRFAGLAVANSTGIGVGLRL